MLVSQTTPELILRECPDRRKQDRYTHRQPVHVDGRPVVGRDISATGIGVVMRKPISVGELVHVTTNDSLHGPLTTAARVARVAPGADRVIVGLQFLHQ